jgi:hypothetical protein
MKRWAVSLALVAASVAVALLAAEAALRVLGYSAPVWYQPDAQLGWALRPGAAGWAAREGRAWVQVNADGRRDRGALLDKPDDVYRIAVLGDSYSEAMQVEREQAYWALLPGRLAACGFQPGRRFEMLNFGVSGYGTAQEYVALETRAMRYRPDLVLLQFTNGNDVKDNSFALTEENGRPFFMLDPQGRLRIDDSFASSPGFRRHLSLPCQAARRLSDSSRVLQLVRQVRSMRFAGEAQADAGEEIGIEQGLEAALLAPPRERLWDEAWRVTEALIARAAEHAERNGARFVVVTVPYAIQVHPDRKVREALQHKLGVPDLFYPDRRIGEFAKRSGILAVTLAPQMQPLAEARGVYFHGFEGRGLGRGHWNPEGHRAAADLIAKALCPAKEGT